MDPNYQESHKVIPDETLGHIMQAYYGGGGLNMTFVEMAIVQFNKHVRLCVVTPIFFTLTKHYIYHL